MELIEAKEVALPTIGLVPDKGPFTSPTLIWVSKAGAPSGCGACTSINDGWYAIIEDTLTLCGVCAHILLAKLLRFHIRLVEGRIEDVTITPFSSPLGKEVRN